jgi:hypothetical protein
MNMASTTSTRARRRNRRTLFDVEIGGITFCSACTKRRQSRPRAVGTSVIYQRATTRKDSVTSTWPSRMTARRSPLSAAEADNIALAAKRELLAAKKAEVGCGNFMAWVEANCELSHEVARRYIRAAAQNGLGRPISSLNQLLQTDRLAKAAAGAMKALESRYGILPLPPINSHSAGREDQSRAPHIADCRHPQHSHHVRPRGDAHDSRHSWEWRQLYPFDPSRAGAVCGD